MTECKCRDRCQCGTDECECENKCVCRIQNEYSMDLDNSDTTSLSINLPEIKTTICDYCQKDSNGGFFLFNDYKKTFRCMDIGQKMHLECYIEHCVKTLIEKKFNG